MTRNIISWRRFVFTFLTISGLLTGTVLARTPSFSDAGEGSGLSSSLADDESKSDDDSTDDSTDGSETDELADLESLQKSFEKLQNDMEQMKKDWAKKQSESEASKKFSCRVGGDIIMDSVVVANQSEANQRFYGDVQNQFDFRDIRFYLRGKGYGNLEYDCTIGLNNGISFKDVAVLMRETPCFSDVRVGYYKVESGMDHLQSIFDSTFTDFSSNTYAFRAGRRMGVSSAHYFADKRVRFFKGVFVGRDFENGADVNGDDSGVILNARLTGLPIYRENEDGDLQELLHFGASYYWDDPRSGDGNSARLRVRPTGWAYSMPYYLNGTLSLGEGTYSVTQAEVAWQKKGFGLLSEGFVGQYSGYDPAYGVNVQGRWFLTPGAYCQYSKEKGCFSGVSVPKNLALIDVGERRCFDGFGAWEAVAMWSWTDLDNLETVPGATYGTFNEFVAGFNWYWNSQTRVTLNWVRSLTDSAKSGTSRFSSDSDTAVLQMRVKY